MMFSTTMEKCGFIAKMLIIFILTEAVIAGIPLPTRQNAELTFWRVCFGLALAFGGYAFASRRFRARGTPLGSQSQTATDREIPGISGGPSNRPTAASGMFIENGLPEAEPLLHTPGGQVYKGTYEDPTTDSNSEDGSEPIAAGGSILDVEQVNFVRLLMLTAEKGTKIFRMTLTEFTKTKCNVATFREVLTLAEQHKKHLSPHFLKKLLWPAEDPANPVDPIDSVEQLDITACNGLLNLQAISDLTDGNHEPLKNALEKIKSFRNILCHCNDQRYSDETFNQQFDDIRQAFIDIAQVNPHLEVPDDEIMKYKWLPITKDTYREVLTFVGEVLSETIALREDLDIVKKRVEDNTGELENKIMKLKAGQEEQKLNLEKKREEIENRMLKLEDKHVGHIQELEKNLKDEKDKKEKNVTEIKKEKERETNALKEEYTRSIKGLAMLFADMNLKMREMTESDQGACGGEDKALNKDKGVGKEEIRKTTNSSTSVYKREDTTLKTDRRSIEEEEIQLPTDLKFDEPEKASSNTGQVTARPKEKSSDERSKRENGHAATKKKNIQRKPKTTEKGSTPKPSPSTEPPRDDIKSKNYSNVVPTKGIPLKLHEVGDYIKKMGTEKGGFGMEFKSLPIGQTSPWVAASQPMNRKKTRYLNVRPYDHSRVHLKTAPEGPFSDYINASYLNGYKSKNKFIATQAPKNPIDDFWTMIWEQDVKIVVMVTKFKKGPQFKCEQYWPDVESSMICGMFTIRNTTEQKMGVYDVRTFKMTKKQSSNAIYSSTEEQEKTVTHFNYTDWLGISTPLYGPWILNFIKNVRTASKNITTPIVVHCSAGIGRTGIYIALDYLIDQAANEDIIDVFTCVKEMRKNRIHMVQMQKQYECIYETMYEALRVGETIIATYKFAETFKLMDSVEEGKQLSALQTQYDILQDIAKIQQQERTTNASQDKENKQKHRNDTVIPNDGHRFLLRNRYGIVDYAEYSDKTVILTQLPLEDTAIDFWHMVYYYNVNTIVSFTSKEGERSDNAQYWPKEETGKLESGPFMITNSRVKATNSTVSCELSLQYKNTTKEVFIMEAKNWSDEDWKPDNTKTVFDLFSEIQKQNVNGKLVIQSLDGGMNAGMYAVLSWMIDMVNAEQAVDIFHITKQIIVVRPEFLKSLEQYKDIYKSAEEYIKNLKPTQTFNDS